MAKFSHKDDPPKKTPKDLGIGLAWVLFTAALGWATTELIPALLDTGAVGLVALGTALKVLVDGARDWGAKILGK